MPPAFTPINRRDGAKPAYSALFIFFTAASVALTVRCIEEYQSMPTLQKYQDLEQYQKSIQFRRELP